MTNTLETASDSLSDFAKKMEIASFYTNGDEERAKQMIAGTLKDIYVVKGRYTSTSSFGAFVIFFNQFYLTMNSIYAVVSNSFALKDLKTFSDWISFEKEITEFINNNEHDDVLGRQLRNVFTGSFNLQFAGELKKLMGSKSDIEINRLFQQVVQNRMGLQSVNMIVDVETISSLDMELYSLTSRKISEMAVHQEAKKEADPDIEVEVDDDSEVLKDKEVRLILRGSLILAPLNGREINLLVVGDRLKLKITDTHTKAVQVLKAFHAYDPDNGAQPIIGRIVSIRRRIDGGYTIFAIVAKGIYVKIEEMENNIKVAIDLSFMEGGKDDGHMSKMNIAIIAGLGVLLLVLIGILIYFFVK